MSELNLIPRPSYVAALDRHRKSANHLDKIKIITGIRRCGKSKLLDIYQDKLRKEGVKDSDIIVVRLEERENQRLKDGNILHNYILEKTAESKLAYVFLDEVQLVSDFADIINSLRMRENIDLYCAGSNSSLLSQNLSRILGGRYISIYMFPLSFKEYISGFPKNQSISPTIDEIFKDYLEQSSFPEVLSYYTESRLDAADLDRGWNFAGVREYLDAIYKDILIDVMQHDGVKELPQLDRVIRFLFSNVGSQSSINNMLGVINNEFKLKPQDKNMYAPILETYINALLDSFVFYKANVQQFGKNLLRATAKYYAVDVGLRYFLLGGNAMTDAGHILENVVYLELLRRGYKVEIGKIGDIEVDFVATLPGGKAEYYQVSQSVLAEETLSRELASLEKLKDNHPKFLLSRDYGNQNYKGIQHVNVLEWLLK
ncbi:MAG: ATP-binding protein [Elusimicrobiota bacterium]|jgi:predicted AAA+ superfamily ATPase|nr:ATP-binding protein [Elusimicrobiota bacterium]